MGMLKQLATYKFCKAYQVYRILEAKTEISDCGELKLTHIQG